MTVVEDNGGVLDAIDKAASNDAETSSDSGSEPTMEPPQEGTNEKRKASSSTIRRKSSSEILKARSQVPASMYMISFLVVVFEFYGGVIPNFPEVAASWLDSMVTSYTTAWRSLEYLRDLMQAAFAGQTLSKAELAYTSVGTVVIGSILYVLLFVPLRAGMWTGQRARRHVIHRFMGLLYLVQYLAAWIEFTTNYENSKNSYLLHFISINGTIRYDATHSRNSSKPWTNPVAYSCLSD